MAYFQNRWFYCLFSFLGLLFTYGITSSGKTWTIQGPPDNPGIVPRTLDVLFNSISHLQPAKCTFKPDGQNGFIIQTELDAIAERARNDRDAEKIAYRSRAVRYNGGKDDVDFAGRSVEDTVIGDLDADCVYSVFVSYVEIYNNYVYDLLQADTQEPGKPYVNGLFLFYICLIFCLFEYLY